MNAIILAGGHSTRMKASGLTTHKPLLQIYDVPNIERTILMLKDFGIDDIIIICGVFSSHYLYLEEKYNCQLVKDKSTSISTLYALKSVVNKIDDTFIIEGDVVLIENIFVYKPYSFYYTIKYKDCEPDSWMPVVDNNGIITEFKIGKFSEPCIFGVSFWSHKDSLILRNHLNKEISSSNVHNHNYFWDDGIQNILHSISVHTLEIRFGTEMNTKAEYLQAQKICDDFYSNFDNYFLNLNKAYITDLHENIIDINEIINEPIIETHVLINGNKKSITDDIYSQIIMFEKNLEQSTLYTRKLWLDYNQKHDNRLQDMDQPIIFNDSEFPYVIKVGNCSVGYVDIVKHENFIIIRRLYIDSIFRNKGIGTTIIKKINLFAKLINREIRVNIYDEQAESFYKKIGFVINYKNYVLN